ncbi:MAG: hypothetical protein GXO94_07605 [Nitrospirae bacterium]|nr:hypothetical protein [Nitrospirota bacterium]
MYLNVYLQEKGYLSFDESEPKSFEAMNKGSKAFALDPSRVYIHLRDKFSCGCVDRDGYEDIRNSVKESLMSLEVEGEKVVRSLFFKEDLYNGECLHDAPDLVVLPFEGFDLKGSIARKDLYGKGPLTGGHTREDATFYINRPMDCTNPDIVDAGVTVLSLLGIDTSGLDGKALLRAD